MAHTSTDHGVLTDCQRSVLSAAADGTILSLFLVAAGLLFPDRQRREAAGSSSCTGQSCQSSGNLLPRLGPGPGRRDRPLHTDGQS